MLLGVHGYLNQTVYITLVIEERSHQAVQWERLVIWIPVQGKRTDAVELVSVVGLV